MSKRMSDYILATLFSMLILTACSNDSDYVYPDMVTELGELFTTQNGKVSTFLTDDGTERHIQNPDKFEGLTADSMYRALVMYAPADESVKANAINVYSIKFTISSYPMERRMFKEVPTDPVDLQSLWVSGNYLNIYVVSKVKDIPHTYRFVQDSITTAPNGQHTLYLSLLHNRNKDVEGFNKTVYMSVPLRAYKNQMKKGDRISFSLNTYKDGMISREFDFPLLFD